MASESEQPVTTKKIPGTQVPNVLKEPVDDPRQMKWMSRVAVSTAIMAAMAAISSSQSGGHLNESMIEQILASDQWAYYQAKGVKSAIVESRLDSGPAESPEASKSDREKFDRYQKEQGDIKSQAESHQALADRHRRQYKTLAFAATALQIGIGVAAVALLLKKNIYWFLALASGAVGAVLLVQGFLTQ